MRLLTLAPWGMCMPPPYERLYGNGGPGAGAPPFGTMGAGRRGGGRDPGPCMPFSAHRMGPPSNGGQPLNPYPRGYNQIYRFPELDLRPFALIVHSSPLFAARVPGRGNKPWKMEIRFFPAATPRETVTTGVLNQVRVSGVVSASTPAIYEANRIAAVKAKRAALKSPAPRTNIVDAQVLPTCSRCQRTFCARISLVGHLRTHCTNNPTFPNSTSNSANPSSDSPTLTSGINSITPTIIETTNKYSSPITPTSATTTTFAFTTTTTTTISDEDSPKLSSIRLHIHLTHRPGRSLANPSAPATPTTSNDILPASTDFSCPQCARNFNSRIGLVGHLRIHRTEVVEPVPGSPTYSRSWLVV
ncbi:unnamed protein product [Schistocephalus solidus]|uniref:C2H2-type domain-containing protein n=1 Tax=Schistocephalus solidus TaxID=70667 RepID=A0A183SR13_SCHSO|nr:unnamed protein product [Schistocephalus solidus]